jgi:hypothetical protein
LAVETAIGSGGEAEELPGAGPVAAALEPAATPQPAAVAATSSVAAARPSDRAERVRVMTGWLLGFVAGPSGMVTSRCRTENSVQSNAPRLTPRVPGLDSIGGNYTALTCPLCGKQALLRAVGLKKF